MLAGSAYRDVYFFADAICINQDDIPERNAQVQCMGDLYAQAEEVLVWLGPGTAESDFIFDICSDSVATSNTVTTKLGEEKLESRPWISTTLTGRPWIWYTNGRTGPDYGSSRNYSWPEKLSCSVA